MAMVSEFHPHTVPASTASSGLQIIPRHNQCQKDATITTTAVSTAATTPVASNSSYHTSTTAPSAVSGSDTLRNGISRVPSSSSGTGGNGCRKEYEATPAGETFVPSLATVLTHLVSLSPAERGQVTRFHAVKPPDISIRDYLERIQKYFGCSNECFVLSLVYIDRIVKIHDDFIVSILNIHRLVITSVMLAAKFFDDVYYSNAFYARVGGVRTKEINLLEWQFLTLVNYHLYVTPREYDQYLRNVLAAVNAGIQRSLVPPPTPPSLCTIDTCCSSSHEFDQRTRSSEVSSSSPRYSDYNNASDNRPCRHGESNTRCDCAVAKEALQHAEQQKIKADSADHVLIPQYCPEQDQSQQGPSQDFSVTQSPSPSAETNDCIPPYDFTAPSVKRRTSSLGATASANDDARPHRLEYLPAQDDDSRRHNILSPSHVVPHGHRPASSSVAASVSTACFCVGCPSGSPVNVLMRLGTQPPQHLQA